MTLKSFESEGSSKGSPAEDIDRL